MTTQTERLMALHDTAARARSDAVQLALITIDPKDPELCEKMRIAQEARAALLAALQEQAREGEAVTVSNEEAHTLAEEWHGQAGGRLAPQLTDNEVAGMLAQFATDRTKDWPKWMQDNARVATASFPKRAAPQPAQPVATKKVEPKPSSQLTDEELANPEYMRAYMDALYEDVAKMKKAAQPVAQPLTASKVYTAMNAITRASKGDIDPTFEEMHAALEAAHGIKA